jgi:hypothetical protein
MACFEDVSLRVPAGAGPLAATVEAARAFIELEARLEAPQVLPSHLLTDLQYTVVDVVRCAAAAACCRWCLASASASSRAWLPVPICCHPSRGLLWMALNGILVLLPFARRRYRRQQLVQLRQDDGKLIWAGLKELAANCHCLVLSHEPGSYAHCHQVRRRWAAPAPAAPRCSWRHLSAHKTAI